MPKGTNDGRKLTRTRSREETRKGRMRMFDQLPQALRQFLANEAAYDHAVTPFWETRLIRRFTRAYLTETEQRNVMGVASEAYGPDHPQARAPSQLVPKNDSPTPHSITNPRHRKPPSAGGRR